MANPVLCVTLNGQFFQMFGSDTRAMGRVMDLVRYDLRKKETQWEVPSGASKFLSTYSIQKGFCTLGGRVVSLPVADFI